MSRRFSLTQAYRATIDRTQTTAMMSRYYPDNPATRTETTVFIVNAFGLP